MSMPSVPRALLVLCLAVSTGLAAESPRGFTAEDLVDLARVSNPQPSPDGKRIVFELRETDRKADKGVKRLWNMAADGRGAEFPLPGVTMGSSPRWSPDGRHVYFLSSQGGTTQIWRWPVGDGPANALTDVPVAPTSFRVSPAGDRLVFSADVFPDCDDLECTARRLAAEEDTLASGRAYDRLFMRHWDTWKDGRLSMLFQLELGNDDARPVPVAPGLLADIPHKPFGGADDYVFAPDGRTLYVTARLSGPAEPWSTNLDIYRVTLDGTAEPENLTAENKAGDTGPVVSPDGRLLAWRAMSRPGFEADRYRILVRDLESGETRELAPDWDRSPGSLAFSPNGESLFATANHLGQRALFRIDLDGEVRAIVDKGWVGDVRPAGRFVYFTRHDLRRPADLYRVRPNGGRLKQLTEVNEGRLAKVAMAEPEQFTFAGWNGATVYAHVMPPATAVKGEKYPVAFLIHGGPQGSFGNRFHYRWNPQTYAGAGYATVFVDFHGSTGYGQAFTDSISGDWGGKPLEDLKKGLAAALDRYDYLDGERVCALGASYGGYMINWIASQWPDRFKCLVNHDGVFDNRMMYYTTEELWFPEWEHGGPYYASPEGHERHNPARYVDQWQAPMLVIHGALDFRVPETQGFAAFTALQRRGIPSRFLYFPDENHWVLKPSNSVLWHAEVNGWLDRWLK